MKLHELHESFNNHFLEKCKEYVEEDSRGNFSVSGFGLKSLKGCPEKIYRQFECSENKLTTLEFGPTLVLESYYSNNNELTSLEGSPKSLPYGNFSCAHNFLTTLKGGPDYVNNTFYCNNNRLTSLEGAPTHIGGALMAQDNIYLKSLEGIHLHIKSMRKATASCVSGANFKRCPIESHVLGLLLIENLEYVVLDNKKVQDIINKHLAGDKDVFDCQNELMDNNFDEYAQL